MIETLLIFVFSFRATPIGVDRNAWILYDLI